MAKHKKCDLCNEIKEAFTDNTTQTVVCGGKTISIFVKVSSAPGLEDICNACFAKLTLKLAKKLKPEV